MPLTYRREAAQSTGMKSRPRHAIMCSPGFVHSNDKDGFTASMCEYVWAVRSGWFCYTKLAYIALAPISVEQLHKGGNAAKLCGLESSLPEYCCTVEEISRFITPEASRPRSLRYAGWTRFRGCEPTHAYWHPNCFAFS